MNRPDLAQRLAPIANFLSHSDSPAQKQVLLCHPLFVEGLHSLSPFSLDLQRWHDRVTSCMDASPSDPVAVASLGNVALALILRADHAWCGRCDLVTDVIGRLCFPFCDWGFLLCTDAGAPLSRRAVSITLDRVQACWRIGDERDHPFMIMPRTDCVRMLIHRDAEIEGKRLEFPDPHVRLKMSCACRLGRSPVRYDPVGFPVGDHAAVAGGIINRIVEAIRHDAPAIYREFHRYMHTVRGFEFPRAAAVGSFSDPTLPGVMGLSVAYTEEGQPCLDPFSFTWFGHEMGHTKNYLCDTVLFAGGDSLLKNPRDWSSPIARYGRGLSVRTLIQIPYVHLYEWELLMDFFEAKFDGLPWQIEGGAAAVGNDFAAEIEESFDLLHEWAKPTPTGVAAIDHFHRLFDRSNERWRSLHVTA